MTHPLRNKISIDVDDQCGIGNLGGVKIEGQEIGCAFWEPIGAGGLAGRATIALLDEWRSYGRFAGLRFVPSGWGWTSLAPEVAAKKASDYITALEPERATNPTFKRIDVVEWDVETHDIVWQAEFLLGRPATNSKPATKGIRGAGGMYPNTLLPATLGYRWGRPGIWTMEGRQGTNTSLANVAAQTGLLIGPQLYNGGYTKPDGTKVPDMAKMWSYRSELRTWCFNSNPDKQGASIPAESVIPYTDARRENRLSGESECVMFATSRLTELVSP